MNPVVGIFLILIVFAAVIQGLVWFAINFWWLLLLGLGGVSALLYLRHPGVRATRALRASVEQGNQQREEIHRATEATKAEMDRVAREWEDGW